MSLAQQTALALPCIHPVLVKRSGNVLPEGNMAYLKIQTLRLSTFMIRIASSSTFFSDSIKEVYSSRVLMIRRDLIIHR